MSYTDEHKTWNHSLVGSIFCIIFKNKIHVYSYNDTLHDTSYLSEQYTQCCSFSKIRYLFYSVEEMMVNVPFH